MPEKNAKIQEVLNIDRIENDAVILKTGGIRKILLVTGISFDLKSEEEKNALIAGYQDFLNSLNFPIQEIIHSRKVNIDGYLRQLLEIREREKNNLLKNLINDYQNFINEFVSKNPIMSKTFFITVPYDPLQALTIGSKALGGIFGFFKKQNPVAEESIDNKLRQINLRVDQVIDNLNRIGIRAVLLTEPELIELFYNFYNPSSIEKQYVKQPRS